MVYVYGDIDGIYGKSQGKTNKQKNFVWQIKTLVDFDFNQITNVDKFPYPIITELACDRPHC